MPELDLQETSKMDVRCKAPHSHKFLYTPDEAAVALAVGRTKIYELMSSGLLGFVLIGSSRRIPAESLQRFVSDELQHQGFVSEVTASMRNRLEPARGQGSDEAQRTSPLRGL